MKTHTLKISLSSLEDITEGLDEHALNPKLSAAEAQHDAAVQALEDKRAELAACEREVTELPGRVHAGRATPAALEQAITRRDAVALLIGPCELAEAEAFDLVQREKQRARGMLEAECKRRRATLAQAAAQLAPTLAVLRDLELALGHKLDPLNYGTGIEWPQSLRDERSMREASSAAASSLPPPRVGVMAWEKQRPQEDPAEHVLG